MPSSQERTNNLVSIQIPQNAIPGDVLTFVVDGNELELVVPEGSVPGDVLEIQVASTSTMDEDRQPQDHEDVQTDNDDTSVTRIALPSGDMLQLHHCIVAAGTGQTNEMNDEQQCDGTHAMPWPAGLELVRYLLASEDDSARSSFFEPRPRRVLELGSGLGLVGLFYACCYSCRQQRDAQSLSVKDNDDTATKEQPTTTRIVLTDCPSAMPLLQYNVAQNQHLISSDKVVVSTQALTWEEEQPTSSTHSTSATPSHSSTFDLILGSDLLYNADSIPALVSTLQRHLDPTHGRVVLAVRWRKPDLERQFFELTQHFLDWTLIISGSCQLSWRQYGNPQHEDSNRYFLSTLISVQGSTPTPLANITQHDVERMTTEESNAWERAQIQIYMGTSRMIPRSS